MKKTNHSKEPICPGKILLDNYLKPKSIPQKKLSKDTALPPRHIREILSGRRAITPDLVIVHGIIQLNLLIY